MGAWGPGARLIYPPLTPDQPPFKGGLYVHVVNWWLPPFLRNKLWSRDDVKLALPEPPSVASWPAQRARNGPLLGVTKPGPRCCPGSQELRAQSVDLRVGVAPARFPALAMFIFSPRIGDGRKISEFQKKRTQIIPKNLPS